MTLTFAQRDAFENGFIRLNPPTHDISHTECHISGMQQLGADLDAAVKAVWPKRHDIRYSQVHVLLVSWEDDDLGVATEIKGLRHVFRDRYHFQVQGYRIPSAKPDRALYRRVLEFLDLDGEGTLLIFYYAGHAVRRPPNESLLWVP
jgi:hypothetical protein